MVRVDVHLVELAHDPEPFGRVVEAAPPVAIDLGYGTRALYRAPNLFLLARADPRRASPPRPVNAPGLAHLCMQTRDGDALRRTLTMAGATFLSPPVALGTGYHYSYGHDRQGRLFEIESAPFLPKIPTAWFGHFAFVSEDAERLASFYGALLQSTPVAGGRFRGDSRLDTVAGLTGVDLSAWWVRTPAFALEFWRYHAPTHAGPPVDGGYAAIGFETDDLEAAIAVSVGIGGQLCDRTSGPDGDAALLADPDGNSFRLIALARPGVGVSTLAHRDVLARAASLASPAASITGASLRVDGGTARMLQA